MTAPGWYKDAREPDKARWHDGQRWTEHTMVMADWSGPGAPPPPIAEQIGFPVETTYGTGPPSHGALGGPTITRQAARADAASAKARAKAMRPWYRKKRVILPAALVVLVLIIAASSGGGKKAVTSTGSTGSTVRSVNSGSHPAADDVMITSCENQGYGTIKVGVTILNHTSKTSNYLVSINVNDATGTKVGDGNASTENLGAGQTAKVDGYATASSSTSGAISCITASVTRYAS